MAFVGGVAGGDPQRDLGAGRRDEGVAGAVDLRGVEAGDGQRGLGPEPLDGRAVADQLDARQRRRTRRAAGPRGSRRRPPGRCAARRRRRCPRRRAAMAISRLRVIRASGTRPPHMPEWTAWVRVRTSTSTRTRPRRLVVSAGTPMSQLPESAITMTSASRRSLVLLEQLEQGVGADLLLALDEHGHADGEVVAERAERAEVGDDAGLVVGRAAAVEAAVALGRLERRAVPVGVVVLGLHVVVGVEQHGRRALRGGLARDHRRGAARRR